ncbi:PTS ascorbate transporter subunit IIB, partial [Klebsiella pneumoniae]
AEHLSSHSAKVVGLSNLLDNNKIKEILAENI